jgi:hypothetical protein
VLAGHLQDQNKAVAVEFEPSRIAAIVVGEVDRRKDRKALRQWRESNCPVVVAGPGMYRQVGSVVAAVGDSVGYERLVPRRMNDHWLAKNAGVSWREHPLWILEGNIASPEEQEQPWTC